MPELYRPAGLRAGFHAGVHDPVTGLVHAGEQWAPAGFLIDPHTHPVWEIYLQVHGTTRWVASGRSHLLHPGQLLAIAPRIRHHLAKPVPGSHHFYYAAIDLAVVLERQPALPPRWPSASEALWRADANALAEPFAQLMLELTARQQYPQVGLTLAIDRLVLATTRVLFPAVTAAVSASRLAVHPAVGQAKDLLDREYDQRWTLDQLAERVGLAPGYLAGLFTAALGQPPHHYQIERRIERAKQLLASSDMTVTDIAISLGFSSGQHFARVFRKLSGYAPLQYRRANE